MSTSHQIKKNAIDFVNLLVPGKFPQAQLWLSSGCKYKYEGRVLMGPQIIKSFSDNHENASGKIKIEYYDGRVDRVEGQTVFVAIRDKLTSGARAHIYQDCLAITCNQKIGVGSIEKIEHCPSPEERRKLKVFLDSVGVSL